jgi:hypothetical protein
VMIAKHNVADLLVVLKTLPVGESFCFRPINLCPIFSYQLSL